MSASDDDLLRIVLVIGAVVLLAPVLLGLVFVPTVGMMGMWGGMGMAGPGFALVGPLLWLVVLLGIGYLVYRSALGGKRAIESGDRALEELRLAYARGDLSHEEYEERRDRLLRDADETERERSE